MGKHWNSSNEHVVDSRCGLAWVGVCCLILQSAWIDEGNVGDGAGAERTAADKTELTGCCSGEVVLGFRPSPVAQFVHVRGQESRKGAPAARVWPSAAVDCVRTCHVRPVFEQGAH